MSDQGATGGDIYLVPATGGEAKSAHPKRQQDRGLDSLA